MSAIFISYRRSDSQDVSGRIYDRLVATLGAEKVFKDVDDIPLSVSFPEYLGRMLAEAKVVLVIIGPTWYTTKDSAGRRRLEDPEDVVRIEVETALRLQLALVPVLVSNATFLPATELPESMREMSLRNGIQVRPDPDFHHDMDRLIRKLEVMIQPTPGSAPAGKPAGTRNFQRSFKPAWAVGIVALLALLAGVLWSFHAGKRVSGASGSPANPAGKNLVVPDLPPIPKNSPPPSTPGAESIAVLPFENIGMDKETEYFSDGVSEEILNLLARVPGLKVLARSSSFSFKGKGEDVRHIGQVLNVSYALEGSVRRAGGRLRISTHLVKVSDGVLAWSENFDRDSQDILKVEDELAQSVVDTLKAKLLPGDRQIKPLRGTSDQVAHDLYLQGRFQFNLRTPESLKLAIADFTQAISRDPQYAEAYAPLGACYLLLPTYENVDPSVTLPKARAAIQRALELDDTLAEAHTTLGKLKDEYDWEWPGAEREFKRAIQLNPNFATVHHWYAIFLSIHGRVKEAIAENVKAEELDPVSLIIQVNGAFLPVYERDFAQAIRRTQKILELNPNFTAAALILANTYYSAGESEKVIEVAKKLPKDLAESETIVAVLGASYARLGRPADALQMIRKLEEISKGGTHVEMDIAAVQLARGEIDLALSLLEKAVDRHDPGVVDLIAYPDWDPLRTNPRFQALLGKMGVGKK